MEPTTTRTTIIKNYSHASGGAVYSLGTLGALIYFIGHAATLGALLLGIVQAIIWPAYLAYYVLQTLFK